MAKRYLTVDAKGKSVGDNFVNIDVMRVIRHAGMETNVEVPGRKRKMVVYGFHSLHHSFASFCAEAGVPKAVVVSILGANSDIIDQFYTHVGEDAQLKAIEAVSGTAGPSDRARIEKALQYLQNLPDTQEVQSIIKILKD